LQPCKKKLRPSPGRSGGVPRRGERIPAAYMRALEESRVKGPTLGRHRAPKVSEKAENGPDRVASAAPDARCAKKIARECLVVTCHVCGGQGRVGGDGVWCLPACLPSLNSLKTLKTLPHLLYSLSTGVISRH
jgi:hypothetical protein